MIDNDRLKHSYAVAKKMIINIGKKYIITDKLNANTNHCI